MSMCKTSILKEEELEAYFAIVRETDEGYEVSFPDFPDYIVTGKDLVDAQWRCRDGLVFHIENLRDGDKIIPSATPLPKIRRNNPGAEMFFCVEMEKVS